MSFQFGTWYPISCLPEGEHVLLYWPVGERGVGGIECATVYRNSAWPHFDYWTHGGPNGGSDFDATNYEKPTHWMPLPPAPREESK